MIDEAEFERLRHHVAAALEYSGGSHSVEDIAEGIGKGHFQLWPGLDSVIVTEIIVYPQLKDLHYTLQVVDLIQIYRTHLYYKNQD